jgi:hypothetical protein
MAFCFVSRNEFMVYRFFSWPSLCFNEDTLYTNYNLSLRETKQKNTNYKLIYDTCTLSLTSALVTTVG